MADAWVENPLREHDVFLIAVIRKTTENLQIWRRVNGVQLYKRVSGLSKITNGGDIRLEEWTLDNYTISESSLKWLPQRKTLPENVKLWREALYRAVQSSTGLYPTNLGITLRKPTQVKEDTAPILNIVHQANSKLEKLPATWKMLIGSEFVFNLGVGI